MMTPFLSMSYASKTMSVSSDGASIAMYERRPCTVSRDSQPFESVSTCERALRGRYGDGSPLGTLGRVRPLRQLEASQSEASSESLQSRYNIHDLQEELLRNDSVTIM